MASIAELVALPTTAYAEAVSADGYMDCGITALWGDGPALCGPAYTVQLAAGDNLMLHAAIHDAPAGAVIVADGVDSRYAVAGGNVCAVAQQRGIAGFVIDGVIRDKAEIAEAKFPVYCRGVVPVSGKKNQATAVIPPITCGGASVQSGDIILADEDGIIVIPADRTDEFLKVAKARLAKEASTTLEAWEANHKVSVDKALASAASM